MNHYHFIIGILIMTTTPFISVVFTGTERPSFWMVALMGIGFVVALILFLLQLLNGRQQLNDRDG